MKIRYVNNEQYWRKRGALRGACVHWDEGDETTRKK
jgi:hypothetical protein